MLKVEAELSPNGGSSIKDSISRIEAACVFAAGKLSNLASALDIGIFETDATGSCLSVSEKWTRLTGVSQDDAKGWGWVGGIAIEDQKRIRREWESSVKESRRFTAVYKTVIGKTIKATASPVKLNTGAILGYVGMVSEDGECHHCAYGRDHTKHSTQEDYHE